MRIFKATPIANGTGIKFDVLDALRGLAALLIAFLHFGIKGLGGAYLAVDFFFLLSGFILAYSYHDSEKAPRTTGHFVINRIARLYPLHIFTFVLFALVILLERGALPQYGPTHDFSLVQQLTMTHNVGFGSQVGIWNYPSWSISVEFWVGMIFIAFVRPSTSSVKLILTSLGIMVFLDAYLDNLDVSYQNLFGFLNSGLLRCLASFLVGVVAYRSWLVVRHLEFNLLAWTVLELFSVFLVYQVVFNRVNYHSTMDFGAPLVFFLVVVIFSMERGVLSRALYNFRYLGEISYSIYLNHLPVMIFLRYLDNRHGLFGSSLPFVFFFVLIAFSALTYHLVELPSKKLLRNIMYKYATPKAL